MFRNRILMNEPEPIRLPQPPAPPCCHQAFVLVAVPLDPAQAWLYQRAFEIAQAVARPSLIERDLLGVWN